MEICSENLLFSNISQNFKEKHTSKFLFFVKLKNIASCFAYFKGTKHKTE